MESVDHYESLAKEYHAIVGRGHGSTVAMRTDRQVELVNEIVEGKQQFIRYMVRRCGLKGVNISSARGTIVRLPFLRGAFIDDIVGESNTTLIENFHKYNPSRGSLNTFIMLQIANGLLQKCARNTGSMTVTKSRTPGLPQVSYESIDSYADNDASPEYHVDDIADDASFEAPQLFPESLVTMPNSSYESREFVSKVRGAIVKAAEKLSERERRIFLSRTGIEKTLSLRELSEELGLSHEGVRFIEKQAKAKVRKNWHQPAYLPLREVCVLYGLEFK